MINLEEFSTAVVFLVQDIEIAIETEDKELIAEIRSYWDNESWESILKKYDTEESTWCVWWEDGVKNFIKKSREEKKL